MKSMIIYGYFNFKSGGFCFARWTCDETIYVKRFEIYTNAGHEYVKPEDEGWLLYLFYNSIKLVLLAKAISLDRRCLFDFYFFFVINRMSTENKPLKLGVLANEEGIVNIAPKNKIIGSIESTSQLVTANFVQKILAPICSTRWRTIIMWVLKCLF